jgi:citrate synthase
MWLRAEEALARLATKPQSLYASVSRGRIRAKPDPADSRRSLYNAEDVERLARRGRGRSAEAVATDTIRWGEPVLASALTTVSGGRLYYRGQSAAALAETATLEDVAALLWAGPCELPEGRGTVVRPSMLSAMATLATSMATAVPSHSLAPAAQRVEAAKILGLVADALVGGDGPLHLRLARHFRCDAAADSLRRALVLLADHELTASTFAARIAVSTGASLAAGTLAGFSALQGPLHGSAATAVAALVEDTGGDEYGLRAWLDEGRAMPGFRHPLYPDGDERCRAILRSIAVPPAYAALALAGERLIGEAPNVDFALAALAEAYRLPAGAPTTIFALARTVGLLAHMLEQLAGGQLIRPRARYVGLLPGR